MLHALPYDDENYPTIARHDLRVLLDGTFVVRWGDHEVQELQSGRYRIADEWATSESITDYELNQLKDAGLVRAYDSRMILLCAMPEREDTIAIAAWEQQRVRAYYLNTTLPADQDQDVMELLTELNLGNQFAVRTRDGFVVLWQANGKAFVGFDEAEEARHRLTEACAEAFLSTVVAFMETTARR